MIKNKFKFIYANENVSVIKKVGKQMTKKLNDAGFQVVADLKSVTNPDTVTIAGISSESFRKIWEQAQQSLDVDAPQPS